MRRTILRTAAVVLLAILLIPSAARGAQDPWKFPGGEKEQRDAEKKYGLYWYEVYPKAVSLFKESNANFDEVIARLRLVASRKPQSGCSEVDPHIPKERVLETSEVLRRMGGSVTARLYPGLGHEVNQDELEAVRALLDRLDQPR